MGSGRIAVDAAIGGPWEILGEFIEASGHEDCSGLRRYLGSALAENDYERFNRMLPTTRSKFDALRTRIDT